MLHVIADLRTAQSLILLYDFNVRAANTAASVFEEAEDTPYVLVLQCMLFKLVELAMIADLNRNLRIL